jgi:hypothetical protein
VHLAFDMVTVPQPSFLTPDDVEGCDEDHDEADVTPIGVPASS